MRLTPSGSGAVRCTLGIAVSAWVLAAAFSPGAHARQLRPIADGVYSGAQAARGEATYKAQCVACHGETLGGGVGPMLAGEVFLSAWSARPLTELVDKIQNTMPLQAPGSLSRPQAIDVAAHMLQVSGFQAGEAELSDAALSQLAFPGTRPAAAAAAAGMPAFRVGGNLAQIMRAITFPNANIIFQMQVSDIGAEPPAPAPDPFDYRTWGNTVYYGWQTVDQAALALMETTPLFLMPGRRCENGRPAPVERDDWKQYTAALIDVAEEAFRASQSRDREAVVAVAGRLNDACANCHQVYRDGETEGTGLGSARCQ